MFGRSEWGLAGRAWWEAAADTVGPIYRLLSGSTRGWEATEGIYDRSNDETTTACEKRGNMAVPLVSLQSRGLQKHDHVIIDEHTGPAANAISRSSATQSSSLLLGGDRDVRLGLWTVGDISFRAHNGIWMRDSR